MAQGQMGASFFRSGAPPGPPKTCKMDKASLDECTVGDLPLPQPLLALRHPGDTLFKAIELLAKYHILSAPVVAARGGALLGLIDSLDIVAHICSLTEGDSTARLGNLPVNEVMGTFRPSSEIAQVDLKTPLKEVLKLFSGTTRRAVVKGPDGGVYSVVTQSLLMQFIQDNKKLFNLSSLNTTASQMSLRGHVGINENQPAIDAFREMKNHHISSVGLLDKDGCIVSVISASDLVVGLALVPHKGVSLSKITAGSAMDYLASNRQINPKAKCGSCKRVGLSGLSGQHPEQIKKYATTLQQARAANVCVSPETPMVSVLAKLSSTRVHRITICKERKPVGVVSLTDICRTLAIEG
mmetsp:Transcript_51579/g.111874  ORF Transcript_51579/g.111874 Transcript_51579/m.111874 type:complete len:354 (-) Transcript_51579:283-1344(-)